MSGTVSDTLSHTHRHTHRLRDTERGGRERRLRVRFGVREENYRREPQEVKHTEWLIVDTGEMRLVILDL